MTDITANVVVSMPSQLFTMARSFKAVANGKIYIGKIDTDPVNPENQIQVYVENEDGSHVPVSQPIIINTAGYPVYNGQIAKFVTVQGHSMAVYDAYGAQQFYFPNVLKYDPDQLEKRLSSPSEGMGDSLIAVKQPFPRAVPQTQHLFNAMTFSVFSWGAKADGVNDDTTAIKNCLQDLKSSYPSGCNVFLPAGEYRISETIIIPDRINLFGCGNGTHIRPIGDILSNSNAYIICFDYGPTTAGAFIRDITITGNDIVKGIGTTLKKSDTVIRQVYALNFDCVTVQNCSIGFEMQGWWHSSMTNCRASGCNIGLRLLGQCVSIHISGCKFTGKGLSQPSSIGIDIAPETYSWSGGEVISEGIIIDGETMCISNNVGIWVKGSLYMHLSNVDIDFVGSTGIILENNNSVFSVRDCWIAAQGDSINQFVGIDFRSQTPSVLRNIEGVEIRCENNNPINNNIGISLNNVSNVNVLGVNIIGGDKSIYSKTSRNININGCMFASDLLFDDIDGLSLNGNYITSLTLLNSPKDRNNNFGVNNNKLTRGKVTVPMSSGATSGTADIPNPISGVIYSASVIPTDAANSMDTVSVSGTTITISRPTPVGVSLPTLVEYYLISSL